MPTQSGGVTYLFNSMLRLWYCKIQPTQFAFKVSQPRGKLLDRDRVLSKGVIGVFIFRPIWIRPIRSINVGENIDRRPGLVSLHKTDSTGNSLTIP